MNKKELDEYCKSLGLVRQTNTGNLWYGYTYPYKYTRPKDMLVGFQVSFKEFQGKKLNEIAQRTIKITNKVSICSDYKCIACFGFYDVEESDDGIKKKIYKMVKQYEKVIGDYKQYIIKSKVKEIEGDFK